MPTKVEVTAEHAAEGLEARELAPNLGEQDALELAQAVYANTGETITLTPYKLKGDEYVLDHKGAHEWPRPQAAASAEDLSGLKVKELKALAAERGVEVPKGAKKDDLVAALAAPEE